jgi:hypothetical protein
MPNHFHGILWINDEQRGTARCAPTVQQFGQAVSGSLPAIIRAFKSAATKRINVLRHVPGVPIWQRGYYEHVIRNDQSLERIREYIINNPHSWELDRENPGRRGENEFYRWIDSFTSRPGPKEKSRVKNVRGVQCPPALEIGHPVTAQSTAGLDHLPRF